MSLADNGSPEMQDIQSESPNFSRPRALSRSDETYLEAPVPWWDSVVNCHTFAVAFVTKMGLTWPEKVPPLSMRAPMLLASYKAFFESWFPSHAVVFEDGILDK